ncbi:hypothetical protein EMIHUDRAFT_239684 [Emiliania huxleyi CCMP1516]|uniref:Methyltransferase FkbM domain-containing protein n=2 Tax=Emiliania huxleyi TaxID=2903 RepID=A0A0D3JIT1_EMIH1|nr:hypothetical protein EMIHUDRAFT_239684 [Emiliania huxleyi CCMP1516]EOD23416.1 hypothetical protein EMIHUDRAFT_239684 [Emiliania huxleyi CCMP1516]|eukprot:XP_005775845.1 hypothetical protein EMIHUDRAFT_239684 [Emiliania huxleyi CCMP1516]
MLSSIALPLIVLCTGSDASQVGDVEGVEATPPAPEGARFRLRPLLLAVPNPHANPRDRPGTWNGQSGQDRTVHALMPSDGMGNRHRFFIDLAANEWRRNSNTRALERDYNWEGLCIEANPSLHASLLSQRNCTVVGAAVASTEEMVRFTPRGVYGGIVGKGMRNSKAHDEDVIEMRTVPFWRILEQTKAPKTIDYMSLDVEARAPPPPDRTLRSRILALTLSLCQFQGAESLVMSSFPWDAYSISVLTVENPKEDLVQALEAHGYVWQCNHGHYGDEMWLSRRALEFKHVQRALARGIHNCTHDPNNGKRVQRKCDCVPPPEP